MARRKAKSEGGGGGGGVTSLNGLAGAVNLLEGAGIDLTILGQDITIAAIGANVPSDTSLAVKVATTAALPGTPIYNNGTSGVGATLTRSSNGTTGTIDGITAANLMVGDYILVKNQSAQLQNGVYSVTQQGSASLPYILTRVTEADTTAELDDLVVTAASGTTNKGVPYGQQTNNPVIGTNNIVFTATGIYMRQQTSGTQAINQIPVYTGTALTQTKGTANFKYNPTNDLFTIRGIDYLFPSNNGDASQVLTTDGSGNLTWTTPAGGSPAGSNNQIQINQSGSFFADSTFQKSDTDFNVGLDHTVQSAVTFTGSGLDDLNLYQNNFTGTYPTTYTVTIDGINKDVLLVNTSSISGGSFAVGNTITNGLGASATIDAISVDSLDDKTIFVISSYTGTFNNGDTIDNGSGVTATQTGSVTTRDTFTWTDGTTTVTQTTVLDSNGVYAFLSSPTGHTLSDSWTWTYSYVNQNVLDFSNNDYNFKSTFGTDTYGYQITDNMLGAGISGSVNTWTTTGGDFGISGFGDLDEGFGINSFIQWASGSVSKLFLTEDNGTYEINYLGSKSRLNLLPNEFDLTGILSGFENGVSLRSGIVSLGNLSGGNGTKITIDDVNKTIALTADGNTAYSSDIPLSAKVTVSPADMLAVVTGPTPYQLIAAPGAGKFIDIISIACYVNFNTTAYDFNAALRIGTNTTGSVTIGTDGGQVTTSPYNMINATSSKLSVVGSQGGEKNINTALYLNAGTATSVTQGDSDVTFYITYKIVTL